MKLGGRIAVPKSVLLALVLSFSFGAGGSWYLHPDHAPVAVLPNSRLSLPPLAKHRKQQVFAIETQAASYYARDSAGGLVPELRDGKNYFKIGEGQYRYSRAMDVQKTALLVMDPWEDSGSDFLNEYYRPIIGNKLLPLIEKSIALGIPVVVLTNPPTPAGVYGSKIHPSIDALVRLVYHGTTDANGFAQWLVESSIDTLIYSGFASNNCLIGREFGMIPMKMLGFRLFFVPEASAAIEFEGSWKSGELHEATSLMISQWIGELIDLNDFLSLKSADHRSADAARSRP
jgi:nicotinamidase-related amidase